MALFGGSRDISLFRKINKELINNIISTEIDFYKIDLNKTKSNIYGEASADKTYYTPVRLACLIDKENVSNPTDEMGVSAEQPITFNFLRDGILSELNLVPEVGDIINWDDGYWEINNINISQYILGKNDLTNKTIGSEWGANWSYLCTSHLTRRNKLHISKAKFGNKK